MGLTRELYQTVHADAFTALNKKIKKQFFPAMLGAGVTEAEEALFAFTNISSRTRDF